MKRKIYNKPKFDLDISNYDVFLDYDEHFPKPDPHSLKVVKLFMAPCDMIFVYISFLLKLKIY